MDKEEINNELEKLRNSEKHYRILMDESMDPTFSFYADGTYRYVNNAFARGVGKTVGEIIGHKIWDDKGYWNQIEDFIQQRSDALFSHAICPACAKKLYPDLGL